MMSQLRAQAVLGSTAPHGGLHMQDYMGAASAAGLVSGFPPAGMVGGFGSHQAAGIGPGGAAMLFPPRPPAPTAPPPPTARTSAPSNGLALTADTEPPKAAQDRDSEDCEVLTEADARERLLELEASNDATVAELVRKNTMVVHGIPMTDTILRIRSHFERFGTITQFTYIFTKQTKGVAMITFEKPGLVAGLRKKRSAKRQAAKESGAAAPIGSTPSPAPSSTAVAVKAGKEVIDLSSTATAAPPACPLPQSSSGSAPPAQTSAPPSRAEPAAAAGARASNASGGADQHKPMRDCKMPLDIQKTLEHLDAAEPPPQMMAQALPFNDFRGWRSAHVAPAALPSPPDGTHQAAQQDPSRAVGRQPDAANVLVPQSIAQSVANSSAAIQLGVAAEPLPTAEPSRKRASGQWPPGMAAAAVPKKKLRAAEAPPVFGEPGPSPMLRAMRCPPLFQPTEDEIANPIEYIRDVVMPVAMAFGLATIRVQPSARIRQARAEASEKYKRQLGEPFRYSIQNPDGNVPVSAPLAPPPAR